MNQSEFKEKLRQLIDYEGIDLDASINEDQFVMAANWPVEYRQMINNLLHEAPLVAREADDFDEFWKQVEQVGKNGTFVEWLKEYTNNSIIPYAETKWLRDLGYTEFCKQSKYCYENTVLREPDQRLFSNMRTEERENFFSLRKSLMTFVNIVVIDNRTRQSVHEIMQEMIGLDEERCNYWYDMIESDMDRLWKTFLFHKINQMEERLNEALGDE